MSATRSATTVFGRLRRLLGTLLGPPEPSAKSLAAIPEHLITLLHVIREKPKFVTWLYGMESMPVQQRKQQLAKLSAVIRADENDSPLADGLERLQDPVLFRAFCRTLRDELQATLSTHPGANSAVRV